MLNAYNADLANVNKALGVLKSRRPTYRPPSRTFSVRDDFRNDIQNASSEQALIGSFATLGKDTQCVTDGTTIANWYTSVCGGTLVTTAGRKAFRSTSDTAPVPETPPQLSVPCPTRSGRWTRWPWRGPGSSTCATAPSSRSRASTPPSCAGSPRRRPTHWGHCGPPRLFRTALAARHRLRRADGHGLAIPDVRAP